MRCSGSRRPARAQPPAPPLGQVARATSAVIGCRSHVTRGGERDDRRSGASQALAPGCAVHAPAAGGNGEPRASSQAVRPEHGVARTLMPAGVVACGPGGPAFAQAGRCRSLREVEAVSARRVRRRLTSSMLKCRARPLPRSNVRQRRQAARCRASGAQAHADRRHPVLACPCVARSRHDGTRAILRLEGKPPAVAVAPTCSATATTASVAARRKARAPRGRGLFARRGHRPAARSVRRRWQRRRCTAAAPRADAVPHCADHALTRYPGAVERRLDAARNAGAALPQREDETGRASRPGSATANALPSGLRTKPPPATRACQRHRLPAGGRGRRLGGSHADARQPARAARSRRRRRAVAPTPQVLFLRRTSGCWSSSAYAAAAATRSAGIGGNTTPARRTTDAASTASRRSASGHDAGGPTPERTRRSPASNSAHASSRAGDGAAARTTRSVGMGRRAGEVSG